jgi:hypothetical protein
MTIRTARDGYFSCALAVKSAIATRGRESKIAGVLR